MMDIAQNQIEEIKKEIQILTERIKSRKALNLPVWEELYNDRAQLIRELYYLESN